MVRNGLALVLACVVLLGVGLVVVMAKQPRGFITLAAPGANPDAIPAFARMLTAEVVMVGKVVSVEKEPVVDGQASFTVAKVKIEDGLTGTKNLTHVTVGFLKSGGPQLAEGEQYLFFLTRHPTAGLHLMPWNMVPIAGKDTKFKAAVAEVTKAAAALKDPVAALKADKPADRGLAAVVLLTRYRTPPPNVRQLENEDLPEEESKLLLKALADADWTSGDGPNGPNGFTAFRGLALTQRDGWTPPGVKPGANAVEEYKRAFAAWLEGKGQEYRVKKLVPKK